jgi:hypothetical protein
MTNFVGIYNNVPHTFLTKIMGFDTTPRMVANDINLENEIIRRIRVMNYQIANQIEFKLNPGTKVYWFKNKSIFEKRRSIIKPDEYIVLDFNGTKYLIKNNNPESPDYNEVETVSRNMLKVI